MSCVRLGDRGRGLTLRQECASASRRLAGRAGSCGRAVPHAPGLGAQRRPRVCPSWRPGSAPSPMETEALRAPSWWTLCPAGHEQAKQALPTGRKAQQRRRGGAGRGSPGSGQMVKNHPRFLLGEKGSQIAHLVQGHTVAPWQGWARGSGAGIEGTLWEPGIQGESPQTHRIPKLRSWFSEAT